MSGFDAFVRKEAREILRTWRIWVLPGILLFFALTGPVLAKYTPEIIKAAGGPQVAYLSKLIPPPTLYDAYAQWAKNLSQIGLFALIIIYGGLISSERKSGTAILVLTKPVSREAFVVAKALVNGAFLAAIVVVGTLVTWAGTALVFGDAPAGALWTSALSWLAFALMFLGLMTWLSVALPSQAGAAGVGIGVYALLSLGALSQQAIIYTPVGLVLAPGVLAMGDPFPVLWPLVTSLAAAVALVALAAVSFRRQEL